MNTSQKNLNRLLQQNQAPAPDLQTRKLHIRHLERAVLSMDYLDSQSFLEKLLTQASYLTPWCWLIQAGILILAFFFASVEESSSVLCCLLTLAPALTFQMLYEMSKSFSHNMWEMEAACRYNLPQLFFFRLCILSGCDFLALGGSLIAFRMTDGALWEFCLCTLLPFFCSVSLCLLALRRFGRRCSPVSLSVIPVLSSFVPCLFVNQANLWFADGFPLDTLICCATVGAFFFFLYSAARLCTSKRGYKIERNTIWN